MAEKTKFNPYIIIIIILVLAVGALAYDKWGGGFIPNAEDKEEQQTKIKDVDTGITDKDIVIGNENAPVTIVEYYSYFCSYCKLYHEETYPQVVENYISTGKVKYAFRPSPPYELGEGALCAKEQDRFSEYHDEIFKNSSELNSLDAFKAVVKNIENIDIDKFNECLESGKYLSQAELWIYQSDKDFETIGVPAEQRGTPTFFINGELILGAHPYDKFVEVIERKLAE